MRKRRENNPTASEFLAQLTSDKEWVARRDHDERRRRKAAEVNLRASAPVLSELRAAGFEVGTIADLRTQRMNYRAAITILMKWLPLINNPAVKEDIVRCLSVKWAKPQSARLLVEEFRRAVDESEEDGLQWAIGNALAVVGDDTVIDDLVDIATDSSLGRSREMVVVALGNMKDPRAVDVLRQLLKDDQVAGFAVMALGRLGAREARPDIEPLLNHPTRWVRQKALEVLKRLTP